MTQRVDVDLTRDDDRSIFRPGQHHSASTQGTSDFDRKEVAHNAITDPDTLRNTISNRSAKSSPRKRQSLTSQISQIGITRSSKPHENSTGRHLLNYPLSTTHSKLSEHSPIANRLSLQKTSFRSSSDSNGVGNVRDHRKSIQNCHSTSRKVQSSSERLRLSGLAEKRSGYSSQAKHSSLSEGLLLGRKRSREDERVPAPSRIFKRPKLAHRNDDAGQKHDHRAQRTVDLTALHSNPMINPKQVVQTSTESSAAAKHSASPTSQTRSLPKGEAAKSEAYRVRGSLSRKSQSPEASSGANKGSDRHCSSASAHRDSEGHSQYPPAVTEQRKSHHGGSEAQRTFDQPDRIVRDSARESFSRDRHGLTSRNPARTLSSTSESSLEEGSRVKHKIAKSQRRQNQSARGSISEEDQGYASLSASNADDSSNKAVDASKADAIPGEERASGTVHVNKASRARPGQDSKSQMDNGGEQISALSHTRTTLNSALRRRATISPSVDGVEISESKERALRAKHDLSRNKPVGNEMRRASRTSDDLARDAEKGSVEADSQLRFEAMQNVDVRSGLPNAITNSPTTVLAEPMIEIDPSLAGLPLALQVESVLSRHLEDARNDNEYWTQHALRRARLSRDRIGDLVEHQGETVEPVSFAGLKPISFSPVLRGNAVRPDYIWCHQKMGAGRKPQAASHASASYTTIDAEGLDVPDYAHYVSLTNNILAPNVRVMHCHPYFGEDFDQADAENLNDQYNSDIHDRERKLLLLVQAQKYEAYAEGALHDIGCLWADVLRFFLEDNPDVGADRDAQQARNNRATYCNEDFSRHGKRWTAVLDALPPSTASKMARVALLCEKFRASVRFSLWHIAWRSRFAEQSQRGSSAETNDKTCRICLRFDCPYHGELKEHPEIDSDSDSISESDSTAEQLVATDIIHPPDINYRARVAVPPVVKLSAIYEEARVKSDKRDVKYWQSGSFHNKADERGPFYPCHHPEASCEEAACSCYLKQIPCEKICSCGSDCSRKFQGCSCFAERAGKGRKAVCFEDERCNCWQLGRECDPDLCGTCGVCEVVDPLNKRNDDVLVGRCKNASLQRGVVKHTILGDSGVHGLGLYACEDIRQNELVGEYKGEIITKEEADRRGAVYEHQKLSYLFSLNASQEIDGTYFGNKMRFINHASGSKANLRPFIIMVNTVHRIALYASEHIKVGQELFFDYGPKFPNEQLGGKKSRKSAPHVRNSGLVQTFVDVKQTPHEESGARANAFERVARGKMNVGRQRRVKARSDSSRGSALANGSRTHPESADSDREDAQRRHAFNERDAGQRLAAFNISDSATSSPVDADADAGAEDDSEEFDPDVSDSDEVMSDGSVSLMEVDEGDLVGRRRRGRPRKGQSNHHSGTSRR